MLNGQWTVFRQGLAVTDQGQGPQPPPGVREPGKAWARELPPSQDGSGRREGFHAFLQFDAIYPLMAADVKS